MFNLVNLHVYHYAGNNPVKYIDPDGETPIYASFTNAVNLDFGKDYMGLAQANFKEGEYGWATVMALDAVFEAAYDLLAAYGGASLAGFIVKGGIAAKVATTTATTSTVTQEITKKGTSVIGPRATYREFAQKIGANFLDVADDAWSWAKKH